MKQTLLKTTLSAAAIAGGVLCAAAAQAPELRSHFFDEPSIYMKVSDNGLWAVTETRPGDVVGGKIVDLTNYTYVTLTKVDADVDSKPYDITDDGNLAVGSHGAVPAYWTRSDNKWHDVEFDAAAYGGGSITSVTPDGRYAVGSLYHKTNVYSEYPAMWDLTTGKIVDLPNLPASDLAGENMNQMRLRFISPDARYIVGSMSFSYPQQALTFLYDRQNASYTTIIFDELPGQFVPRYDGVLSIGEICMSPDGKLLGGQVYVYRESTGEDFEAPFVYDIAKDELRVFDAASDRDVLICNIDNNGNLYGGATSIYGGPLRNLVIRSGKYWYDVHQIMSQCYGMDVNGLSTLGISGTPSGVSGDGRTLLSFTDPQEGTGWSLRLPEGARWDDLCANVDLLGRYAFSPAAGTALASMYEMTVAFDRQIDLVGDASEIELLDEDGQVVRYAMGASVIANRSVITFRRTKLDYGKKYTVRIPAGIYSISGDRSVTNREVNVDYVGLGQDKLVPSKVLPEDGSSMTEINYSTFNINIAFPALIKVADDARAYVETAVDHIHVADLTPTAYENVLILSSVVSIPLQDGIEYNVVVEAGAVTDLSGLADTATDRIELHYTGMYRGQTGDNRILFSEDFNQGLGNKFLFYEGDHNTPSTSMVGWGFANGDQYPWWIARSSNETWDYAAVSHSMYRPAGKSDDWMVINRILIPDANTRLVFDSQSYRKNAQDRLTVMVIPSDVVYGAISDDTAAKFRAEGTVVYDELQTPGKSEEDLEDDWKANEVDLGQFAGKYVYIAFINQNEDQSAVFVDNIQVIHDMRFNISITSLSQVVAQDAINIEGYVNVDSSEADYTTAELELLDADGNSVDLIKADGIHVNKENPYKFAFAKSLPLISGKENKYVVRVKMDDEQSSYERTVTDLAFETTKRAVLEEFTGQTCGNCPLGIRAVEEIQAAFGDLFIPVVIRSYNGDAQTPQNSDYATRLGLSAAPSGVVNRHYMGSPLDGSTGSLKLSVGNTDNGVWYDFVVAEINDKAPMDIDLDPYIYENTSTVNVDATINYAIDTENQSLNLFAVLLENSVPCIQDNYFTNNDDPMLGPWGQGGILGMNPAPYIYNHLARNVSDNNCIGTPGRLPVSFVANDPVTSSVSIEVPARHNVKLENCDVVVMLYDNVLQRVVNANKKSLRIAGVENIVAPDTTVSVTALDDTVTATADGDITLAVYDLSGRMLGMADGNGTVSVNVNGYDGVAVVRVRTAAEARTLKVVL